MAKAKLEIGGKEYLFELDRAELRYLEDIGFSFQKLMSQPQTQTALFWAGALHKNQPRMAKGICVELLDKFLDEGGDPNEIMEFLTEQYKTFSQATQVNSNEKKKMVILD